MNGDGNKRNQQALSECKKSSPCLFTVSSRGTSHVMVRRCKYLQTCSHYCIRQKQSFRCRTILPYVPDAGRVLRWSSLQTNCRFPDCSGFQCSKSHHQKHRPRRSFRFHSRLMMAHNANRVNRCLTSQPKCALLDRIERRPRRLWGCLISRCLVKCAVCMVYGRGCHSH
jgi:hypothetical protein